MKELIKLGIFVVLYLVVAIVVMDLIWRYVGAVAFCFALCGLAYIPEIFSERK